ncbi:hypothetical protein CerSpe_241080 [Prunus speciosa]
MEFHHSTYWIQLHGIRPLNMTTMVARKIGSLVRKVLEVDQADGAECIGRFLRVHTQLDVDQPLMRGAFVQFPNDGAKWVNFQYEFLPEYCFVCGHLGHPSCICMEKLEDDQDLAESKVEDLHNFSWLEAVEDLRGRRLRFGECNVSWGSNSTSSGGRWRQERSSRLGEPRHLQQVGWQDGVVHIGLGVEMEGTATSPNKQASHSHSLTESIRLNEKNKSVNDIYKRKLGKPVCLGHGERMRGLHRGNLLQISICKRRRVGIPKTGYGYLRRMGT